VIVYARGHALVEVQARDSCVCGQSNYHASYEKQERWSLLFNVQ
jgi:hypothetical protein